MPTEITIRVLLLKGQESWIAQGLEYNIAAQGDTVREAKEAFLQTVVGQIAIDRQFGQEALEGISPAPREYWEQFQEAERVPDPVELPEGITPGFMIPSINQDFRVYA